jgi:hypothetical protein
MITNDGKSIIGKYLINQAPSYAGYLAVGCGSDPDNYQSVVPTSWSISGSTVTVTFNAHNFVVGESLIINFNDSRVDGIKTVATITANTFTFPANVTIPTVISAVDDANPVTNLATYTTGTTAHNLKVGDLVTTTGFTDGDFNNADFTVISLPTTVTFVIVETGTGTTSTGTLASVKPITIDPNAIIIRNYANKKTLDYEMFRVPIVSRAFNSQTGETQVILTGELPTQDRYLMTEAAIFSSGTNPIASLSDSRSLYSFSEGEGWEKHNVTATAITTFTATSIANVNGVINTGNGNIANLTAFALESTDAMFDSDGHKYTNSKPRLLSNFIVVRGDLSEINTASTTWTAVDQPHIHIQNQRFGFGVNSSTDQLKLAFSVINRNPILTANAAVAPDNAYVMIEFSDSENQTDGILSTTGTVGTVSGTGPYTANITGMSSTNGFYVGQLITATAGTGSFGAGVMTVTSIASNTSINISSTATFTAGTITNILGTAGGVSNNQYARMQVALSSTNFANVNGSRYFVSTKTLGELATSAGFSWESVKLVKVYVEVDAPASLDNTVTYKEATGGGSTKTVRLGLGTQPHKFEIGDFVTVTGVDSTFNGTYVIDDEKHNNASNNYIEYKIISGTTVSNTAATGNVTFSRANYYVLFDGLRFENIADLELNPLYGMTAYTTLNDLDTFANSVSTRVPITKDVNTNTLLEFRLNLELNAEG